MLGICYVPLNKRSAAQRDRVSLPMQINLKRYNLFISFMLTRARFGRVHQI